MKFGIEQYIPTHIIKLIPIIELQWYWRVDDIFRPVLALAHHQLQSDNLYTNDKGYQATDTPSDIRTDIGTDIIQTNIHTNI